ncbi:uncharacterized protein [Cherax quadricarinatus]|uniref:uncharacterized protein isoform X3 n=1 Tax=Cherax quadricarinatus TaxID=27406 RepID=UPI00387E6D94
MIFSMTLHTIHVRDTESPENLRSKAASDMILGSYNGQICSSYVQKQERCKRSCSYRVLPVGFLLCVAIMLCFYSFRWSFWKGTQKDIWKGNLFTVFSEEMIERSPPQSAAALVVVMVVENHTEVKTHCSCKQEAPEQPDTILSHLQENYPWINRTTSENLKMQHPNFPIDAVMRMIKEKTKCTLLPEYSSISWVNTYWQVTDTINKTTLYLYSAVYDNRTLTDVRPCVRVLVTTKTSRPSKPWCHLWFNVTGPPSAVRAERIEYLDYQKQRTGSIMPFLVTCKVPSDVAHLQPIAASILPNPCTSTSNLLQVVGSGTREASAYVHDLPPHSSTRYTVGVCGPALYYYQQDFSSRVVEWLELLKAMDIARVFLYETEVHPNLQKVLRYYETSGFLEVTRYHYPPPYDNDPNTRRLWTNLNRHEMFAQENIYFSDCLLRHMHQHRFIAHFDPDEVPVIIHNESFTDFFNDLLSSELSRKSPPSGYQLQWNIFYDNVYTPTNETQYLHVLGHTKRTKSNFPRTGGTVKTIYDMDTVTGVFSHGPLVCASGECSSHVKTVDYKEAYLGHYTRTCKEDSCMKEKFLMEDKTLLRYKHQVKTAVKNVLQELKLL